MKSYSKYAFIRPIDDCKPKTSRQLSILILSPAGKILEKSISAISTKNVENVENVKNSQSHQIRLKMLITNIWMNKKSYVLSNRASIAITSKTTCQQE